MVLENRLRIHVSIMGVLTFKILLKMVINGPILIAESEQLHLQRLGELGS